jgi:hypothetical protein
MARISARLFQYDAPPGLSRARLIVALAGGSLIADAAALFAVTRGLLKMPSLLGDEPEWPQAPILSVPGAPSMSDQEGRSPDNKVGSSESAIICVGGLQSALGFFTNRARTQI